MKQYFEAPEPLSSFLIYIENIQGKSPNTAKSYYYDLSYFYKYLKLNRMQKTSDISFRDIPIDDVDLSYIKNVDLSLIYEYMNFLNRELSNSPRSRARKIASLRSFFKYLHKSGILEQNPLSELETIKLRKTLPVYFTLEDSMDLLSNIDGKNAVRDYCIITLFLNCGMRLSELVGINITDIRGDVLTVVGKGNKERTIYLNDACINALTDYLSLRKTLPATASSKNALFLSSRNQRISRRTVQHIVEINVKKLGLDPHKYTTHKLRHTAATLMYQAGVDIRALQNILGHEQLSTTEIYTHLNDSQLRAAVSSNPLANIRKEK